MKKILLLLTLTLIYLYNVNAQTVSVADAGSAGSSGNVITGASTYHAVEAIYLDAEIGASNFIGAGNAIQSIKFACNNTSTGAMPASIPGYSIYMKNVPATSTIFTTGTYSLTGYTLVFSGSLNVQSAGAQYSFLFDASATLTTPFARTAGTNLQVLVIRNSGTAATGYAWDCSNGNSAAGNVALTSRRYNGTVVTAENSTSLSTSAFRPAIQLIRPIATDASIASVLSSPSPSCFNTVQSISVNLKNTGTSTIATGVCSVKIDVTGAGTYTSTLSNTGALAANTTEIITFSSIPMNAVGVYDIKIYSQLPGDVNASNDTVSFSITNTGVYTTYPVSTSAEVGNPLVFQYLKTLSGNNHWSLNSSLTTSATGAFKNADLTDSIYPHSGKGYYVWDSYSGASSDGHRGVLYAGCFSFSSPASISFWMTNDNSLSTYLDSIYVVYSSDKGQTWNRIPGAGFGRVDAFKLVPTWVQKTVDLSSYVGQTIQLGFEGVSKWGNVIGLDDIVVTTPCFGMPTAGTATSSKANACSGENFALNLTGNSSGSGQTYQWQQSSTGSAPWTNVGSATNSPSFTTTQTSSYYYRCEVTCTNSGFTDYSSSIQVTTPALVSGTFTIDKNGGGDFTSFADAINYIKCGINGAVIFNVAPGSGPYNEQIIVSEVYGASASNTITINGNGETLTFSGGTVTNPNTLSLDGADYFVFNYLNIEATGGEYGIAAHLYNAADNNKFSNCTFTSSITGTVTTQAAFVISGAAATVATIGNSGNGNIVDGCTMIGGYYSAVIYGNSTVVDNKIINSTARDFYVFGIYNYNGRNTIIRNNIVERVNRTNPSAGYGIYLSTGSYNCTVDRNRVRKLFDGNPTSTSTAYCLYNAASAAAGFENKWTNNLVSDIRSKGTIYGMYCPTYDYVQIYHNTISLDDATSASIKNTYGIRAYGNPLDIKNNIVTISRGGTGAKYCLHLSSSTTTTSDNNVLYMNAGAGTNYVAYRSSGYATLGAWQTATSLDMHSFSVDPLYSNPSTDDYAPIEPSIDNMGAAVGVLTDINGATRSPSSPDIGAYEYVILPCSGTPSPGNTVANVATACPNVPIHLSLQYNNLGSGITYEWQMADDASFTVNVASIGTNYTKDTSQTAAKYYRCKVTCTNSGLFTYSTPVFIDMNALVNCYCTPATTGGTTYYISGFTTTGGSTNISKTISSGSASGYQNFFTTDQVTINRGASIAYSINVAGGDTYGFAIWIDSNQDGIFQPTEQVLITSAYASSPKTGTVTIPNTALLGTTRMRILAAYIPNNPSDPCNNSNQGEYQDYAITITPSWIWTGTTDTDWNTASNWDMGSVPTSTSIVIIPNVANKPVIAAGTYAAKNAAINTGSLLTINGTLQVNGNITNNATITGSGALILDGLTAQTFNVGTTGATIASFSLNNTSGVTLSGTGKLNITNVLTVQDGSTLTTGGVVVLKSDATNTARLAPVGTGIISGNVTVERYIPAKASRYWSLLSSPVTQGLQDSWQQQIHITGAGTGGTICPSLTAHTNGFDATLTNTPSAYTYKANEAPGSRWQAVSNTNATNVGPGKGFRVNVRGPRSLGCDLLNGVNMVPSAVTLSSKGTISNAHYNMGNFSITYPNTGTNNWVLVGNPYPSALSFSALQGNNSGSIGSSYAIYIPANNAGVYTYWNGFEFIGGGNYYDNNKGNIIASGQAVFFKSTGPGSVILDFKETHKVADGTAGYFRNNNTKDRVRISLNKDKKIDEVVVRYANDATVSNTAIGEMDIPSMNSGTYITSLKGNQPMVVQTRALNTLSTDEVWLNIGATQSGNYAFNFSDYENFAGTEIYLVDHLAKTTQNIKENATYVFSVDVNNAATKGSERFSLVFNRNVKPSVVYNTIKMYPNPANKQITFLLPQSADISYSIKVTDMAGKIVLQHKAAGGTEQMSIDKLTTGTYIVEIIDSKGNRTTEKLIKN